MIFAVGPTSVLFGTVTGAAITVPVGRNGCDDEWMAEDMYMVTEDMDTEDMVAVCLTQQQQL